MDYIELLNELKKKPYPEVTTSNLTDEELNIITNIYAGEKSELTSLTQYSFQHTIIASKENSEKYSKELEEISITEMLHFEIIGKILVKSGNIPKICKYIDNNKNICQFWNSGFVNYTTENDKIIISDIELENAGIREYERILKITKNQNLKDVVSRILEDEYLHLKIFKMMKKIRSIG